MTDQRRGWRRKRPLIVAACVTVTAAVIVGCLVAVALVAPRAFAGLTMQTAAAETIVTLDGDQSSIQVAVPAGWTWMRPVLPSRTMYLVTPDGALEIEVSEVETAAANVVAEDVSRNAADSGVDAFAPAITEPLRSGATIVHTRVQAELFAALGLSAQDSPSVRVHAAVRDDVDLARYLPAIAEIVNRVEIAP